jgi:hypothetical protein
VISRFVVDQLGVLVAWRHSGGTSRLATVGVKGSKAMSDGRRTRTLPCGNLRAIRLVALWHCFALPRYRCLPVLQGLACLNVVHAVLPSYALGAWLTWLPGYVGVSIRPSEKRQKSTVPRCIRQ